MTTTTAPRRRANAKTKIITAARAGVQPSLADLQDEGVWLEWRSRIPEPLRVTDLVTTDQGRAEFLEGARLLRLDQRVRAGDGQKGPTPIQLVIADELGAGHLLNAVLEPRRTTKTTSIQCVLVGRGQMREDYVMGWTVTMVGGGQKGRERFLLDIVAPIRRVYPDPKSMPFKINEGKGSESISWARRGNHFALYAPTSDGFRSGGFDVAWVDEAGEADPEISLDLIVSVLPTMDTKPGAQFIASGTAASYTTGNLLYDTLEDPTAGVIRHGVPQSIDPEELEDWEPSDEHPRAHVRELIEIHHPGVGYTTPLEAVERNFRKFPRDKFTREYLGLFGTEGAADRIIPPAAWERTSLDGDLPPAPAQFALAMAVHPDGLWSSLGVAWYLQPAEDLVTSALALEGVAPEQPDRIAIGLLHHQSGIKGFALTALQLARKYNLPIIYDKASQAAGVEIETLQRATPPARLIAATTEDVRRGATKMLKLLDAGVLVHFRRQSQLERAAEIAIKRGIGTYGGFGFGRPKNDYAADITPLEACSLALQYLDDAPKPTSPADAMHFG